MIVMDNKNLINGSTALAPKFKPNKQDFDEELKKHKKAQKEKEMALANSRARRKAKILFSIICSFLVGVLLIGRYAAVYNLQKDLININAEIHNTSMENENLKVQVLKASNIQLIEETARTKLNMITPDKNNVIYIEATKDYFAKNTEENNENSKENIIAKIKKILF